MSRPVERTGKLHLLVVDEDAAIRSACCEIATDLGFVPQTVSSIEAARTLLRDQGIDVLLLDLRAPLDEGLGLLHEIKALNPGLVVVVMTAYATVPAAVEAMRTGAADYLTKPFAMDELAAVLERAVERTWTATRRRQPPVTRISALRPGPGQHDRPQPGDGQALPHSVQGGAKLPSRC